MGLQSAVYSWGSVKALNSTIFSMNVAGVLAVVLAIIWATRLEKGLADYLNLVSSGDGHFWTAILVVSASICVPAYFLGIKSYFTLRLDSSRSHLDETEKTEEKVDDSMDVHDVNRLLFLHAMACLVSGFLVALLNAACLVRSTTFQQKSRNGLLEAIENYGNDVVTKARVDAVQTNLECCGDSSYKDWFKVPWLKISMEEPVENEEGPRLEGQPSRNDGEEEETVSADVPFSCCSNDVPKPCVHHDILKASTVYEYDPKFLTISTIGCRSKIVSRGETLGRYLMGYLGLLSIYQTVLSVLARLLQTAHSNDLYIGPRKSRYNAWIFFRSTDRVGEPLLRRRRRKKNERKRRSRGTSTSSKSSKERVEELFVRRGFEESRSRNEYETTNEKISTIVRKTSIDETRSNIEEQEEEDEEEEEDRSSGRNPENSSIVDLPPPPPPPPPLFDLPQDSEKEIEPPLTRNVHRVTSKVNVDLAENEKPDRQNRRKVLDRFDRFWRHQEDQRQTGGADRTEEDSPSSSRSRKRVRSHFDPSDAYDRFRGTLQHTLARREIAAGVRKIRTSSRVYSPRKGTNLDTRRTCLLSRLRCNNVPPSYRLLASCELQKRTEHASSPPPPPPLPPFGSWTRDWNQERDRGQCSVCNRPVRRFPDSCVD